MVTGQEILDRALDYSDEDDSDFISSSEALYWVNVALGEIYDMLVLEYQDYLVADPVELTTTTSQYLDLPVDFFKMRKVFYKETNYRIPLYPFHFDTMGETSFVSSLGYDRYRITGNKIWFESQPTSGKTIEVWYIPQFVDLDDLVTSITFPLPNRGWEEYAVFALTARIVLKNEEDASSWLGLKEQTLARIKAAASQRNIGEPMQVRPYRSSSRGSGWGRR